MNCPRCDTPNFRFACEGCGLLCPSAAKAAGEILEALDLEGSILSATAMRAGLQRSRRFEPEDVEAILRALRLMERQGLSFPLWGRMPAKWNRLIDSAGSAGDTMVD